MNKGRGFLWCVVAFFVFVPLNWARITATDGLPKGTPWWGLVLGTVVCWGVAYFLAKMLISGAKKPHDHEEREVQQLQLLLNQPLTEIRPHSAILKPGEKAYGSVRATLHETQTMGYSAGTAGVSVHVAKGVTIRTGGMKGRAVKGVVSVASGELVVTDQRIIFAGDMKSFAIQLGDLLNVTNYTDGFGFNDGKSTRVVTTDSDRDRIIFSSTLGKVLG